MKSNMLLALRILQHRKGILIQGKASNHTRQLIAFL